MDRFWHLAPLDDEEDPDFDEVDEDEDEEEDVDGVLDEESSSELGRVGEIHELNPFDGYRLEHITMHAPQGFTGVGNPRGVIRLLADLCTLWSSLACS